jgi:hypothetical protein
VRSALRTQTTAVAGQEAKVAALARLNHPAVTGAVAFVGWLAFVLARLETWADGHISLFIMSGQVYSHPAQMPPDIMHVLSEGYDGQFYYRLALNPFNWHRTAYGITMDYNYRYTRIGYPLVTWIISAGQHDLVPVALIVVNLACVAAMGVLGGMIARDSGRHALWGLLFVAYFGLVISVGRDTIEPLADACMLAGLLAYRRSRHVLAAVLLAYGVITNEPVLAFPAAIAVTRLYEMYRRRARPGRQDLAWVLPGAAVVVLQGIEHFTVKGKAGGLSDITQNFTLPFKAMVPALYDDIRQLSWTHLGTYDYNLIEFIALAAFVVAGLLVLRSTTAPVHERVAFVFFILGEMVLASWQIWGSTFGEGRVYIDTFLLAVVVLLATPRVAHSPDATASRRLVIANKHLGVAAAIAAATLIVIARRHILYQ